MLTFLLRNVPILVARSRIPISMLSFVPLLMLQ
jgi:hypothetical protein